MSNFCVSNVAGDNTVGESGSVETSTSGLEFIISMASQRTVVRTSWVSHCCFERMELRIFLATPIILSQVPPICGAFGGLRIHVQFLV